MASHTKRAASTTGAGDSNETDGGLSAATNTAAELTRQHMANVAQALSVAFRATESLQQAQLHMVQRAALLHSQAAENIRSATTPMELMTIQASLLAQAWQESLRYGQELIMAAAKGRNEVLRPGQTAEQEPLNGAAAGASAAASMMGAAMNAAVPMADAFQQMFMTPLTAAGQKHH